MSDSAVFPTELAPPGHPRDVALSATALPLRTALGFREIYEAHFDFVWRVARRLGVSEAALDDAVQDVFIVVHRRLNDFEGRSSMKSWIYAITRRVAKDHRRRVSRKDRGKVPADETLIDGSGQSPAANAEKSEAVALLYKLLDQLDEDKREVFVLADLCEMTVPEIAESIGVNTSTIYSRLRAARAAFDRLVARQIARQTRETESQA